MKKSALATMGLIASLAACASPTLNIREVNNGLAPGNVPANGRVAEGHAQMQLGNTALALEAYRKALRADPGNADAHAGMAAAYDRMGRFDLSTSHYQTALAITPDNPRLYEALASSLAQQGRPVDAARVMAEAQVRRANPELAAAPIAVAATNAAMPVPGAISILTPEERAALLARQAPELQAGSLPVLAEPLVGRAVNIRLAAPDPEPVAMAAAAPPRAPRIERLSNAEAMLVTKEEPVWASNVVQTSPAAVSIQFTKVDRKPVPVPPAEESQPPMLAVLPSRAELAPVRFTVSGEPIRPTDMARIEVEPDFVVPAEMTVAERSDLRAEALPVVAAKVSAPATAPIIAPAEVELAAAAIPVSTPTRVSPVAPRVAPEQPSALNTRQVPIQFTRNSVEPAPVLLINATRSADLASETRTYLADRGFAIEEKGRGTARATTVLFYPKGQREAALQLARQFGLDIAVQLGPVREMTLHLGNDAAAEAFMAIRRG